MRTEVCDICKIADANWPNYEVKIASKREVKVRRFLWDSQGGCWTTLHICECCVAKIKEAVALDFKEATR